MKKYILLTAALWLQSSFINCDSNLDRELIERINYSTNNIVQILNALNKGANPNAKSSIGHTALYEAAGGCIHDKVVDGINMLMLQSSFNLSRNKPISSWPSDYCHAIEIVKLLIERGSNISAPNSSGDTPMHQAAQNNCTSIVSLLLDSGADIEAKSNIGGTPLFYAAVREGYETVKILLDCGASTDMSLKTYKEDKPYISLFEHLEKHNKKEMLEFILKHCKDNCKEKYSEAKTPKKTAAPSLPKIILNRIF